MGTLDQAQPLRAERDGNAGEASEELSYSVNQAQPLRAERDGNLLLRLPASFHQS